jgi:hypothetical protein
MDNGIKDLKERLLEKYGRADKKSGKKEKYYDIKKLLIEAYEGGYDYLLPLGTRNKGKSYQAKEVALWEAYNECEYAEYLKSGKKVPKFRWQFAYIRRWDEDVPVMNIKSYFNSHTTIKMGKNKNRIEEITNGEYNTIEVWQKSIYFAKWDKETGKTTKGKEIGRVFVINIAQRYKSLEYLKIGNLLCEEIIPDDGDYCLNEVTKLTSICSTIARGEHIRIFLIGNTLNTYCPYFKAWNLKNVLTQKPGSIEKYRIDTGEYDDNNIPIIIGLAVEMCSADGIDRTTIGDIRKSVAHGEWNIKLHPMLPMDTKLEDYECFYDIIIDSCGSRFMMKLLRGDTDPFLYVYPYGYGKNEEEDRRKLEKVRRRISDKYDTSPLVTLALDVVTKYDEIVRNLVKNKKICFSDGICGEEFYNMIKERGGL